MKQAVFFVIPAYNEAESVGRVVEQVRSHPDVVFAAENKYMCSDPGQKMVKTDIRENELNRVVVASCTPRTHEPLFRTFQDILNNIMDRSGTHKVQISLTAGGPAVSSVSEDTGASTRS